MSAFNPSDKVVCVDDSPGRIVPHALKKGMVYVVSHCGVSVAPRDMGLPWVAIVGMGLGSTEYGEVGFICERFRLLADVQAENRLAAEQRKSSNS